MADPVKIVIFDGENTGSYDIVGWDEDNNYVKINGVFKNHTSPTMYEKFSVIQDVGVLQTPSLSVLNTLSA